MSLPGGFPGLLMAIFVSLIVLYLLIKYLS